MDIGDSLGEDLGIGLADVLGPSPLVKVVQAAYGDSGLARPDFYDWPAHFAADLAQYHPQVVTVLIGGNDAQNFLVNGQPVVFGTAQWHSVYAQRVDTMMSEATAAGARLVWVGLPIMQDPAFAASMQTLNAIYAGAAATHPGVLFLPTWSLFSSPSGQYSAYLTNSSGQQVLARDSDGVHLATGGCDIAATAVKSAIERAWKVRLTP